METIYYEWMYNRHYGVCNGVPVSAQGNGGAELSKLADSNEIRLESQIAQMRKETALQKKANIAYGKLKATVSNEKN